MGTPMLADDAVLADVEAGGADRGELHLCGLGQSGFLLRRAGRSAVLEPYLSDSLTEKSAGTDKPHERLTERVIAPERPAFAAFAAARADRGVAYPVLRAGERVTVRALG